MAKILVCNPKFYEVVYSINPWMRPEEVNTDKKLAVKQWNNLVSILKELEVDVLEMEGQQGLPDMVFTANAGVVFENQQVVLADFKCKERQLEKKWYRKWFEDYGYEIIEAYPENLYFEGAGDALFKEDKSKFYFGYGFRSDYEAVSHSKWKTYWKEDFQYMKLIDSYFYHLDTCFCPLQNNFALVWTGAFEDETIKRLEEDFTLLKVPECDARKFACNAVAIDKEVIIPSGCDSTKKLLNDSGFDVYQTNMSEFIKAGGACKCLTLRID